MLNIIYSLQFAIINITAYLCSQKPIIYTEMNFHQINYEVMTDTKKQYETVTELKEANTFFTLLKNYNFDVVEFALSSKGDVSNSPFNMA